MKLRLYIECTSTASLPFITGIQRVVREVVINSYGKKSEFDCEIIPFIIKNGKGYAIECDQIRLEGDSVHARILNSVFFSNLKAFLKNNFSGLFDLLRNLFFKVFGAKHLNNAIDFCSSDVIFYPDNLVGIPVRNFFEDLEKIDPKNIFLIHDLIPVTHSKYCDPKKNTEFLEFLNLVYTFGKGVIANSKSTMDDFLNRAYQDEVYSFKKGLNVDYFHLGVNVLDDSRLIDGAVTNQFDKVFQQGVSTFLMVGTLEPRKNHNYVLDVFEKLWARGDVVNLLILGRAGGGVNSLLKRMEESEYSGSKLFYFSNVSDLELVYCYQQSTSLIFPTFAEGFGLPVIESLHYGLPVIASRIPAIEEIAGNSIMYIDPSEQSTLLVMLEKILDQGVESSYCSESFEWNSWDQATRDLMGKLIHMSSRMQ